MYWTENLIFGLKKRNESNLNGEKLKCIGLKGLIQA